MMDACGIKGPTPGDCSSDLHWQRDEHIRQHDVLQPALQETPIFEFVGQVLKEETGDEDEEHRAIRHRRHYQMIWPTGALPFEESDAVFRHDEEYGQSPKAVDVFQKHESPEQH